MAELAALIAGHSASVCVRWSVLVEEGADQEAAMSPGDPGLVECLLDGLVAALNRNEREATELEHAAEAHGLDRADRGYGLERLIEEYGALRRAILELVEERGAARGLDATMLVHELLDHALCASLNAFLNRRTESERRRRLATFSHDLRAPMHAIYQVILLLQRDLEAQGASERSRSFVEAMRRNIIEMRDVTARLLEEEQTPAVSEATVERRKSS